MCPALFNITKKVWVINYRRNTQAITVDLPIEPETSYTVPK